MLTEKKVIFLLQLLSKLFISNLILQLLWDCRLLHTTFLFADAWTGVSIAEYPLANRTKMGVLTALNKKHQNPP